MAQLITVRLNKSDQQPLGFRLQGGKDFGTPLVVQKVNGGSAAERAGIQAGDALIRVNTTDVYTLRHQEAQDTIRAAGPSLELTVQRGGGTWRPTVTPTGSLPRPGSRLGGTPTPVTSTSLKANPQASRPIGSGHNNVAKPFGYMNGNEVKSIVNKQYNTPVNMYSEQTIAETLSAQTEVLAGGVLGVNFKKNEKTYDAEKSAVFKVLQEEQNDPEPVEMGVGSAPGHVTAPAPASGLRHVSAPLARPDAPLNNTGGLPPGQNICEECERLITGVFVRIKDKNLHVECFKCATCGSSLKNQGYYNLNGKLYCDIHAKLVARQNPPASNLDPVTVPLGGRIPSNTYSTPLPPLATNNYTNGSSSMFSPSSNLSGPKPFGSSIGSAYSPSLSPRSAPMSPARPGGGPANPAPHYAPAPAPAQAPQYAPAPAAPAPHYAPAPAPAPQYAPAPVPAAPFAPSSTPAAPFAPTKNVKSVVWPPPNPPEDEPPQHESNQKLICEKRTETAPLAAPRMMFDKMPDPASEMSKLLQKTVEETMMSSQQMAEYSSSTSYASAAMSTATATTSKSESIMQSKQAQVIQESKTSSCTVQSFSEQASSESQSMTMYQSQTSPPIQKSFANPMDKTEATKKIETTEVRAAVESKSMDQKQYISETVQKIEPKDINAVKAPEDNLGMNSNVSKETTETNEKDTSQKAENPVQTQSSETSKSDQTTVCETEGTGMTIKSEQETIVTQAETVVTKTEMQTFVTQAECREIKTDQQTMVTQAERRESVCPQEAVSNPNTNIQKEIIEPPKKIVEQTFTNPEIPPIKPLPPTSIPNSVPRGYVRSMVDALTTAPDRPYSPLPAPTQPIIMPIQNNILEEQKLINQPPPVAIEPQSIQLPSQPSPMFAQQPKRGISPIPPIKTYNPPEKREAPIPMPEETKPYIPPDFKIIIEPKIPQIPRDEATTPLIDALTTAPNRPFTPVSASAPIERGSLKEALTTAPDRAYSPLPLNITNQASQYTSTSTVQVQSTASDIVRPIATQTTTQMTDQVRSEFSTMQNVCQLQSSSEMSAFRPVARQVFPPPQPEEFCKLTNFPPISNELKTSFEKSRSKHETMVAESKTVQQSTVATSSMSTQGFSSVKTAQSYFEQLDQQETLSSTYVRSKSGLQKPDRIPPYQKNFDQLPSQRGITPELCNAPAVLQTPVTPTTDPPIKPRDKSQEPKSVSYNLPQEAPSSRVPQVKTPVQQPPVQFHNKDTPITMTFQPVSDDIFLRASPARSRPTTPSLINKPAPIIPYYQMNLVTVEHLAPESHMYEPSSPETSRSPTPRLRSKSPAPGPPPNPLKAQAPRIKESTPQRGPNALLTKATLNLRKEHEMAQKGFQSDIEVFNASGAKNWAQDQPSVIKEQRHSNVGFQSENYSKGDIKVKEDSMVNQNYGQRQMQSQNVSEYGNTTVQTTRKTYEEFERTQSAKVIEIRKGGSSSSNAHQQTVDSNLRPSQINPKQVFPPPVMSLPSSQQSSSVNFANDNVSTASKKIESPSTSGANQGPVCDPTPSTGSGVGAAGRGKAFGVSSAPKRGRGVLNKAAVPGSRVPLCGSCNGNIRGPFITALGRIWCPEHFICTNATCRRPLQDIGFVEENGQLYCEYCFEQYIAPACDKCHAKIKGDCLNAIGKHFHPECFSCVYCSKLFGNNPFFLEDGLPYCEADWNELFTTKCFACGFPVEAGDRWVEALNNNYHSQCFNCTVCKKNLEGQSFFAKGGRPFCKSHAR